MAQNGWYSDGTIVRQQISGVLYAAQSCAELVVRVGPVIVCVVPPSVTAILVESTTITLVAPAPYHNMFSSNQFYPVQRTDSEKKMKDFKNQIKELSKDYKIAGYGASGRANMFCNLTDLDENVVEFIVDESPESF